MLNHFASSSSQLEPNAHMSSQQTDLPKSFKAAQIHEKGGKFQLVDVDWKNPERGQVVVKVSPSRSLVSRVPTSEVRRSL